MKFIIILFSIFASLPSLALTLDDMRNTRREALALIGHNMEGYDRYSEEDQVNIANLLHEAGMAVFTANHSGEVSQLSSVYKEKYADKQLSPVITAARYEIAALKSELRETYLYDHRNRSKITELQNSIQNQIRISIADQIK